MLLPPVDYYAIQDISQERGTARQLKVVAEYDNEAEADFAVSRLKVGGCEVYWETERDGKRYRVICPKTNMNSDSKDAL
jgi:hypothetical protein